MWSWVMKHNLVSSGPHSDQVLRIAAMNPLDLQSVQNEMRPGKQTG